MVIAQPLTLFSPSLAPHFRSVERLRRNTGVGAGAGGDLRRGSRVTNRAFHQWGIPLDPNSWMVYVMENGTKIRMMRLPL